MYIYILYVDFLFVKPKIYKAATPNSYRMRIYISVFVNVYIGFSSLYFFSSRSLSISRRFRCCFFEIYTHHHRDYSAKIERVSFSESNKHANKIYTNRFLILYIFKKNIEICV